MMCMLLCFPQDKILSAEECISGTMIGQLSFIIWSYSPLFGLTRPHFNIKVHVEKQFQHITHQIWCVRYTRNFTDNNN